jgi:WW domain-containing oxidoreductase
MVHSNPFGARSTADQVLAGVDLTGRYIVVTGCNSGLGFETMSALAANGAHVIGLARTLADAMQACRRAGPSCSPVACDLADLGSVADAADTIRSRGVHLDAIVANAGIANLPTLQTRNGIELQFMVNHVGHFALVNQLTDIVRDGTGRIVIVSSSASIRKAPAEGIMFDNLDGRQAYEPFAFYGQSKLAASLYAKELSRRLAGPCIRVRRKVPASTSICAAHWRWPSQSPRFSCESRNAVLQPRRCWRPARGSRESPVNTGPTAGSRKATRCSATTNWRGGSGTYPSASS